MCVLGVLFFKSRRTLTILRNKHRTPDPVGTSTKEFCLKVYTGNLSKQSETLKHMPPENWHDFAFCLRMLTSTESTECLRYMPIGTRNVFRKYWGIEWLLIEDELWDH